MELNVRKCTRCGGVKSINDYYQRPNVNHTKRVYYKSECKQCTKERTSAWKQANLERFKSYQRSYYQKKKEGAVAPSVPPTEGETPSQRP